MVLLGPQPLAQAEDDKRAAREREAMRRLQVEAQRLNSQLQTLEVERGKLSAESSAKEKALLDAKSELSKRDRAEKSLRGELKTRIAKAREELEKLEQRFVEVSGQLKEMTERNARNEATLANRDSEIRDLQSKLSGQREVIARQTGLLSDSEQKNAALAKIIHDVMNRYKEKGVVDALLQREPFTRIEKVRLQNTLQEFQEKVNANRIATPDVGG